MSVPESERIIDRFRPHTAALAKQLGLDSSFSINVHTPPVCKVSRVGDPESEKTYRLDNYADVAGLLADIRADFAET